MMRLDEVPDGIDVVWFGRGWDDGCTADLRVEAPSSEFCHGCLDPVGPRASGVVSRDSDGRWLFYDPVCWGDAIAAAKEAIRDAFSDDGYAGRPAPDTW